MYTAAGLIWSSSIAHRWVLMARPVMLKITPDAYIQVRSRNGRSWLKSLTSAPTLATSRPAPTLNSVCRISVGIASSQYTVSGSPVASRMTTSTAMDSSICCSSMIT